MKATMFSARRAKRISFAFSAWTLVLFFSSSTGNAQYPTDRSSGRQERLEDELDLKGTDVNVNPVSASHVLDSLLQGYDKRIRPNYGGKAVDVDVTMHITSITSISEENMDFTIDFYFRQFWTDPRLTITKFPNRSDHITLGPDMMGKIWMPDTFFTNEKSNLLHQSTTTNTFLRIRANGGLYTSVRLTKTLECEMDLSYFPLDYQNCSMHMESYGFSTADIQYYWKRDTGPTNQISFDAGRLKLPQFKVLNAAPHNLYLGIGTGQYSSLICELMFARRLGYYVTQIFMPASCIVVISWVSFWLSRESAAARMSVGMFSVLTMTMLISSTHAALALPKVSYITAMDVYLATCFLMVFASLLEYAIVGYTSKRMKMRAAKALNPIFFESGFDEQIPLTERNEMQPPNNSTQMSTNDGRKTEFRYKSWGGEIDKYSRILFPVIFIVFNLAYWLHFLSISG